MNRDSFHLVMGFVWFVMIFFMLKDISDTQQLILQIIEGVE